MSNQNKIGCGCNVLIKGCWVHGVIFEERKDSFIVSTPYGTHQYHKSITKFY